MKCLKPSCLRTRMDLVYNQKRIQVFADYTPWCSWWFSGDTQVSQKRSGCSQQKKLGTSADSLKELSSGAPRKVNQQICLVVTQPAHWRRGKLSHAASSDFWTQTVLLFVYHPFVEGRGVTGSLQAWVPSLGDQGSQHSTTGVLSTQQRVQHCPTGHDRDGLYQAVVRDRLWFQ